MTILQAIVLGIIQGLTEFLPISSTAHLRIIPALLGWEDPGAAFTAVIQIGTLVAVLAYFYQDIWRMSSAMLNGVRTGQVLGTQDAKMGVMILVGTVPIVVVGVLFKNAIETTLRSLYIIALTMIVLALMLALAEYLMHERLKRNMPLKSLEQVGWWECLVVGVAQCFALIPGASRSGVTITGGLLLGLERESAARFSFLLSLPSVFAAGIFQLIKSREALLASANDAVALLVATLVSGVIGYTSIAFLLGYLRKNSTLIFILYRIAVGTALLALLLSEKLPAD